MGLSKFKIEQSIREIGKGKSVALGSVTTTQWSVLVFRKKNSLYCLELPLSEYIMLSFDTTVVGSKKRKGTIFK